jgi:hypothetical protein
MAPANGPSRHFAVLRNLVAIEGIAEIDRPAFITIGDARDPNRTANGFVR